MDNNVTGVCGSAADIETGIHVKARTAERIQMVFLMIDDIEAILSIKISWVSTLTMIAEQQS